VTLCSEVWSLWYKADDALAGSVLLETGTRRTMKKPRIMGSVVPSARTRRKDDTSPGNKVCAIVENMNAESPNPETTRPVTVAFYSVNRS
jgi:hypothetical protein